MNSVYDLPVKFIMENNIVDDIVYSSNKISEKLEMVSKKLKEIKNPLDFLIVVLNKDDNTIKGMITYNELGNLLDKLKENKTTNFEDICIEPLTIKYTSIISEAIKKLDESILPILLVTDNDKKYFGKVKQSKLKKKINELRLNLEEEE